MNRDRGDEVDWQDVASNIVKEIPMLLVDYNCKCLLAKRGTNFKICYCPLHKAADKLLTQLKLLRIISENVDHDCGTPMGDACQFCGEMQEVDDLISTAEGK